MKERASQYTKFQTKYHDKWTVEVKYKSRTHPGPVSMRASEPPSPIRNLFILGVTKNDRHDGAVVMPVLFLYQVLYEWCGHENMVLKCMLLLNKY